MNKDKHTTHTMTVFGHSVSIEKEIESDNKISIYIDLTKLPPDDRLRKRVFKYLVDEGFIT